MQVSPLNVVRSHRCTSCKKSLPAESFGIKQNGCPQARCIPCRQAQKHETNKRREFKERARREREQRPRPTRDDLRRYQMEWARDNRARLRGEMVAAYGGACTCCGESETRFLTLEHLHGRTEVDDLGGTRMYALARRLGWPDNYTVLCFNCNIGKSLNGGSCPHINKGVTSAG